MAKALGDSPTRNRRYSCLPASFKPGSLVSSDIAANPEGGGVSKIDSRICCWSWLWTRVGEVAIPKSSAFLPMRSQSNMRGWSGSVPWHMKAELPPMLTNAGL